jgi:hypothetical protein
MYNKYKKTQNLNNTRQDDQEVFEDIITTIKKYETINIDKLQGENLSVINKNGQSIIHEIIEDDFAFSKNLKYSLIYSLINKHISFDIKNKNGDTPLLLAAQKGLYDIVKLLCDNNADINVTNNKGLNILHYTVLGKIKECRPNKIKKLIESDTIDIKTSTTKKLIKDIIKLLKKYKKQEEGKKIYTHIQAIFNSIQYNENKKVFNLFYEIKSEEQQKLNHIKSTIKINSKTAKKDNEDVEMHFRDDLINRIKDLLKNTLNNISIENENINKKNLIGTRDFKFIDNIKNKVINISNDNKLLVVLQLNEESNKFNNKINEHFIKFVEANINFKTCIDTVLYLSYYIYRSQEETIIQIENDKINLIEFLFYRILEHIFKCEKEEGKDRVKVERIKNNKIEWNNLFYDIKDKDKIFNEGQEFIDPQLDLYFKNSYKINKEIADLHKLPYNYPFVVRPNNHPRITEETKEGFEYISTIHLKLQRLFRNDQPTANINKLYIAIHATLNMSNENVGLLGGMSDTGRDPAVVAARDAVATAAAARGARNAARAEIINNFPKIITKILGEQKSDFCKQVYDSLNGMTSNARGDMNNSTYLPDPPPPPRPRPPGPPYLQLDYLNKKIIILVYSFYCLLYSKFNDTDNNIDSNFLFGSKFALKLSILNLLQTREDVENIIKTILFIMQKDSLSNNLDKISDQINTRGTLNTNYHITNAKESAKNVGKVFGGYYQFYDIHNVYPDDRSLINRSVIIGNHLSDVFNSVIDFINLSQTNALKPINPPGVQRYTKNILINAANEESKKIRLSDKVSQKESIQQLVGINVNFYKKEQLVNIVKHFSMDEPISLPLRARKKYDNGRVILPAAKDHDPPNISKIDSWIEFLNSNIVNMTNADDKKYNIIFDSIHSLSTDGNNDLNYRYFYDGDIFPLPPTNLDTINPNPINPNSLTPGTHINNQLKKYKSYKSKKIKINPVHFAAIPAGIDPFSISNVVAVGAFHTDTDIFILNFLENCSNYDIFTPEQWKRLIKRYYLDIGGALSPRYNNYINNLNFAGVLNDNSLTPEFLLNDFFDKLIEEVGGDKRWYDWLNNPINPPKLIEDLMPANVQTRITSRINTMRNEINTYLRNDIVNVNVNRASNFANDITYRIIDKLGVNFFENDIVGEKIYWTILYKAIFFSYILIENDNTTSTNNINQLATIVCENIALSISIYYKIFKSIPQRGGVNNIRDISLIINDFSEELFHIGIFATIATINSYSNNSNNSNINRRSQSGGSNITPNTDRRNTNQRNNISYTIIGVLTPILCFNYFNNIVFINESNRIRFVRDHRTDFKIDKLYWLEQGAGAHDELNYRFIIENCIKESRKMLNYYNQVDSNMNTNIDRLNMSLNKIKENYFNSALGFNDQIQILSNDSLISNIKEIVKKLRDNDNLPKPNPEIKYEHDVRLSRMEFIFKNIDTNNNIAIKNNNNINFIDINNENYDIENKIFKKKEYDIREILDLIKIHIPGYNSGFDNSQELLENDDRFIPLPYQETEIDYFKKNNLFYFNKQESVVVNDWEDENRNNISNDILYNIKIDRPKNRFNDKNIDKGSIILNYTLIKNLYNKFSHFRNRNVKCEDGNILINMYTIKNDDNLEILRELLSSIKINIGELEDIFDSWENDLSMQSNVNEDSIIKILNNFINYMYTIIKINDRFRINKNEITNKIKQVFVYLDELQELSTSETVPLLFSELNKKIIKSINYMNNDKTLIDIANMILKYINTVTEKINKHYSNIYIENWNNNSNYSGITHLISKINNLRNIFEDEIYKTIDFKNNGPKKQFEYLLSIENKDDYFTVHTNKNDDTNEDETNDEHINFSLFKIKNYDTLNEIPSILNTEDNLDNHLNIIKHRIISDILNNIEEESNSTYDWNKWAFNNNKNNIKINDVETVKEIKEIKEKITEKEIRARTIAQITDDIIISEILSFINKSIVDLTKNGEVSTPENIISNENDIINNIYTIDTGFKVRFNKLINSLVDAADNHDNILLISTAILLEGHKIENPEGYYKQYLIKEDSDDTSFCKVINIDQLKYISNKIDPNIKDKRKQNILFYLINSKNYKLIDFILGKANNGLGMDIPVQTIESKNYNGITPLEYLVNQYISYLNEYKKNDSGKLDNIYYRLYRENTRKYKQKILSNPEYKNNLPTYYRIILPMTLILYCLNIGNLKLEEKEKNNYNFTREDSILTFEELGIPDKIQTNIIEYNVGEKYDKLLSYRKKNEDGNEDGTKDPKNIYQKTTTINKPDNKTLSHEYFDNIFKQFEYNIFSYNEVWKKILSKNNTELKNNHLLNKTDIIEKLEELKQEIKENKSFPEYEKLKEFFDKIKIKDNKYKKYVYLLGKIDIENMRKTIIKDEKGHILEIFAHVVKTVIFGSLYLVLLKTCAKYLTTINDVDDIKNTQEKLKEALENYLFSEENISLIIVKNVLDKYKPEKHTEYQYGVDSLFSKLTNIIQNVTNVKEDSILLNKIRENIFPLYEETLTYFIKEMQRLIKSFNSVMIAHYTYSSMMTTILEKAANEHSEIKKKKKKKKKKEKGEKKI